MLNDSGEEINQKTKAFTSLTSLLEELKFLEKTKPVYRENLKSLDR